MVEMIKYPTRVKYGNSEFENDDNAPRGGSIKATYEQEVSVVQIHPAIHEDVPADLRMVLSRWIGLNSELLNQQNGVLKSLAAESSIGSESLFDIQIPVLHTCEDRVEGKYRFVVTSMQKVCGIALSDESNLDLIDGEVLYEKVTKFVALLHDCPAESSGWPLKGLIGESLIDYYNHRLSVLARMLRLLVESDNEAGPFVKIALSVLRSLSSSISSVVDSNEIVCPLHGDLRPSNILIGSDKTTVWIVDFDQGLFGGDYLVDLWKLGLVSDGKFRPQLPFDEKVCSKITNCYFDARDKSLGNTYGFLSQKQRMDGRIALMRADLLISSYILRYSMGWMFHSKYNALGEELRGCLFIEEVFKTVFKP